MFKHLKIFVATLAMIVACADARPGPFHPEDIERLARGEALDLDLAPGEVAVLPLGTVPIEHNVGLAQFISTNALQLSAGGSIHFRVSVAGGQTLQAAAAPRPNTSSFGVVIELRDANNRVLTTSSRTAGRAHAATFTRPSVSTPTPNVTVTFRCVVGPCSGEVALSLGDATRFTAATAAFSQLFGNQRAMPNAGPCAITSAGRTFTVPESGWCACGPTSAAMALAHAGEIPPSAILSTAAAIYPNTNSAHPYAASHDALKTQLANRGLRCTEVESNVRAAAEAAIRRGEMVILRAINTGTGGHFVFLVGYNNGNYMAHDPMGIAGYRNNNPPTGLRHSTSASAREGFAVQYRWGQFAGEKAFICRR